MLGLFPKSPFIPVAEQENACEWVMPVRAAQRRNYFSTCKALPPGMPDYLYVSTDHSDEGSERCVAAFYSGQPYVIHYEFNPRIRR